MNSDGTVDVMTKDSLKLAPMEPGSVLLEMVFGEVCGTDVHLQHGRLDMVPYPIIPGHVAVGKVYNVVGSVTDVDGSKVGKRASHMLSVLKLLISSFNKLGGVIKEDEDNRLSNCKESILQEPTWLE